MKLTAEEMALAQQALRKLRPVVGVSADDIALMKKYPRHTLAQAREIEGAPAPPSRGIRSGFEFLQWQERGNDYQ